MHTSGKQKTHSHVNVLRLYCGRSLRFDHDGTTERDGYLVPGNQRL